MKKCINILSFVFSLVALVLSVYAVSCHSGASIPALVLSLVGICATLIVGISVIDTIVLRSVLHKVDDKMEEQAKKMEELSKVEEDLQKTKQRANMLLHLSWGMTLSGNEPYTALLQYWRGFSLASQDNDIKCAKACLVKAEILVKDIAGRARKHPLSLDTPSKKLHEICITDELKSSHAYAAFGDRIEKLLKTINSLIDGNNSEPSSENLKI